jgi:hypothetical protein
MTSLASFVIVVNRQLNPIFVPKISTWQVISLLNDLTLISLSHKTLEVGFEDGSKVIARKILPKDRADLGAHQRYRHDRILLPKVKLRISRHRRRTRKRHFSMKSRRTTGAHGSTSWLPRCAFKGLSLPVILYAKCKESYGGKLSL